MRKRGCLSQPMLGEESKQTINILLQTSYSDLSTLKHKELCSDYIYRMYPPQALVYVDTRASLKLLCNPSCIMIYQFALHLRSPPQLPLKCDLNCVSFEAESNNSELWKSLIDAGADKDSRSYQPLKGQERFIR